MAFILDPSYLKLAMTTGFPLAMYAAERSSPCWHAPSQLAISIPMVPHLPTSVAAPARVPSGSSRRPAVPEQAVERSVQSVR
jgi:hypothetical protein